jgi:hypothetical protein
MTKLHIIIKYDPPLILCTLLFLSICVLLGFMFSLYIVFLVFTMALITLSAIAIAVLGSGAPGYKISNLVLNEGRLTCSHKDVILKD